MPPFPKTTEPSRRYGMAQASVCVMSRIEVAVYVGLPVYNNQTDVVSTMTFPTSTSASKQASGGGKQLFMRRIQVKKRLLPPKMGLWTAHGVYQNYGFCYPDNFGTKNKYYT